MSVRQDGPLLVGAQDENTDEIKPLLRNAAGELIVTSGGAFGADVNLISVGGDAIALGQTTMAASLPVVIASNQTAIPVSGTVTAANASVAATGGAVPASATYVGINVAGNIAGAVAGHGTAAGALRVELPTDGTGVLATVGAVTTITNAVTVAQGTATSLKAEVIGAGTAGTANSGVVTVQGIASMTPVQVSQATASSLNAQAVGNIAHDSADSGNPLKVGAVAYSPDGTTPGTAVAEGDRTNAKADLDGRVFVNTQHPRWWSYHSDGSSALTDASVQADPGDGFQIVITTIAFSTGAATACNIFFEEGSTKILGPWYLEAVAGRGVVWVGEKFVTPSTAVTVTTSASIAQSVDVQGYIQAVT